MRKGLGLPEKETDSVSESNRGLGLPESDGKGEVLGDEENEVTIGKDVFVGTFFQAIPSTTNATLKKQKQSVFRHSKSLRLACRELFFLVCIDTTKRRVDVVDIACL